VESPKLCRLSARAKGNYSYGLVVGNQLNQTDIQLAAIAIVLQLNLIPISRVAAESSSKHTRATSAGAAKPTGAGLLRLYQVGFERVFDSFRAGVDLATERQKMTLFFSFVTCTLQR
jgi:hypothetical protein